MKTPDFRSLLKHPVAFACAFAMVSYFALISTALAAPKFKLCKLLAFLLAGFTGNGDHGPPWCFP